MRYAHGGVYYTDQLPINRDIVDLLLDAVYLAREITGSIGRQLILLR